MNPRLHDEFVALCALFYSGEITDEEWALLQVHMAYCESCRQTFEEFRHVAKEVIPAMASVAAGEAAHASYESAEAFEGAERRLMGRLETISASPPTLAPKKRPWKIFGGALAAGVVALMAFAAMHAVRKGINGPEQRLTAGSKLAAPPLAPFVNDDQSIRKRDEEEIAQLKRQIASLQKGVNKPDLAIAELQQRLLVEQTQHQQLVSDAENLKQQLASAQASVQALRGQLNVAQAGVGNRAIEFAALDTKVRTLTSALDEANSALESKDRVLALDKDFLAHDKDIRDLIGARNLYIADIFDTAENGKTAKPFGRIFYTQDRSLVFYGFDLEKQSGVSRAVTFQAWGSGADHQPVSLGLFYQDDSHKRWVVRCDDAKTLARLNMVFVTMEPPGGSSKPTGKQLLRAYLQIQANHP